MIVWLINNIRRSPTWELKWKEKYLSEGCCCSVSKPCLTLRPHGLQHTRLPCPSSPAYVCSNSCPLSQWCQPTISFSVIPFYSCPQSFQHQGLFKCSNYRTIALISHTSKVMLKILQARLQQYMNCELPDVQDGFRKGRGTRNQIANIHWIIKKVREFQKNIYFCFIDYVKAFNCLDHNKLWKILKEMGISDQLIWLLEICM